jgi:hypothetical protein
MFRTTVAAVLSTFFLATSAQAADAIDSAVPADRAVNPSIARLSPEGQSTFAAAAAPVLNVTSIGEKRPAALVSLYAGLAALQAYDLYSTSAALKSGAREANPVMTGVVGNPVAFIAVKAGITGVSIFASERMWKQHHRAQAIAVMAVSNGLMAVVAAHNHSVIAK